MTFRLPHINRFAPRVAILTLIICMWGFVDVPIFMTLSQLLFVVITVFEVIWRKHGRILRNTYIIWSFFWLYLCFLSIYWSNHTDAAISVTIAVFQVIVLNNLLITAVDDQDMLEFVFDSFIVAGVVLSVRLLIVTPVSDWLRGRLGTAIVTHVNTTSINLLISELFAVYKIVTSKEKRKKIKYILFAVLFCALIIASASKKTAIFMVFGPVMMILVSNRDLRSSIKGFLIIIAGCCGLLYLLQTFPDLFAALIDRMEGFINLLTSRGVVDKSTADRRYLMLTAGKVFLDNPILGVGLGNYKFENWLGLYAHSNPLEILACLGIVGFITYYSLYATIVYRLNKLGRTSTKARLLFVIFICLCMVEVICVTYESESNQLVIAALWMAAEILNKAYKSQSRQTR